jgi:hypothetical protein
MDVNRLSELAVFDLKNLIPSENNVKYRIVIPFLHAFGHEHIDLEHASQGSRIDINIGNRIVVETKALNQHLDNHVQQLSDYCGREWPVLAILTNGRDFRIYSPQWRRQSNFRDKIIYAFNIAELKDEQLLNRLEKILGRDNYQNEKFFDNISQREKELLEVGRKIDDLRRVQNGSILELKTEIGRLKEQLRELNNQILQKEKALSEVESVEVPGVEALLSEFFVPRIQALSEPIVPPPTTLPPSGSEPAYIRSYREMLRSPDSLPSRMKKYIDEVGSLSWADLKKACVQRLGCKTETSGSIGASLRVLELEGHVRTSGRSETRRIISTRIAPKA